MKEQALLLGRSHPLVGVLSMPAAPAPREPAVIILNAGLVHHVGPNRWSVRLARRLAGDGHLAARFDHSGIGDSDPRRDTLTFEQRSLQEVREVMDDLQQRHSVRSFVLLGLCSGAKTALQAAQVDDRVAGAVMVNPGGGQDEGVERHLQNEGWASRYWSISLLDPGAWWRALSGRIEYRRLLRVLWTQLYGRLRPPKQLDGQVRQMADLLARVARRGTKLIVVFSANDASRPGALQVLEHPSLARLRADGSIRHTTIDGSDHTFSLQYNQDQLLTTVAQWMREVRDPAAEPSYQPAE